MDIAYSYITESRIFNISDKVFTLDDIRRMALVIWNEYDKYKNSDSKSQINISVKCFDRSHYQSRDITILNDDSVINKKRIESISVTLEGERSVHLLLKHGVNEESSFDVSSNDNMWVNAITGKLNEELESIIAQKVFFKHNGWQLTAIIFLLLTTIGSMFMDFLNRDTIDYAFLWKNTLIPDFSTWDITSFILWSFFGILFSMGIADKIKERFQTLYPTVELQIGPEHKLVEKQRRSFYFLIASLVIIPIALSLLIELIL